MPIAMTPEEFAARTRAAGSARQIIDLLRSRVVPSRSGADLDPFLRAMMGSARHFNEDLGDTGSAVELWTEVYAHIPPGEGRQRVIATMMSVASKRAHTSLPREQREVGASVAIYEAVFRLNQSPEQNARVIRTMMDVANRFTDLHRPLSEMDAGVAIALWRSVHRLHASDEDRERVVRTMMDIANRLTDLRVNDRLRDFDAAIRIWRAICELDVAPDAKQRVVRTMMALANRLTDLRDPAGARDVGTAVLVWQAVHELTLNNAEDGGLHAIKTMMDVANRLTDVSGDRKEMDVDAAIAIWIGVTRTGVPDEDRRRAVLTMMSVAGRLAEPSEDHDDALDALKLWHAVFCNVASESDRLRVVKTVMDIADKRRPFCARAAAELDQEEALAFDPGFRSAVKAGLLYYMGDFDGVIALADGEHPVGEPVIALKADALRKLHRYDESIDLCSAIIRRHTSETGTPLAARDALVSALCCRGYCFLEKGRSDAQHLPRAIEDLDAALHAARSAGVPVPPRVFTGLSYVFRLQGRTAEADDALARAQETDHDNRKALEAFEAPVAAQGC